MSFFRILKKGKRKKSRKEILLKYLYKLFGNNSEYYIDKTQSEKFMFLMSLFSAHPNSLEKCKKVGGCILTFDVVRLHPINNVDRGYTLFIRGIKDDDDFSYIILTKKNIFEKFLNNVDTLIITLRNEIQDQIENAKNICKKRSGM